MKRNYGNSSSTADMIGASILVGVIYLSATSLAGLTVGIIWGVASVVAKQVAEIL